MESIESKYLNYCKRCRILRSEPNKVHRQNKRTNQIYEDHKQQSPPRHSSPWCRRARRANQDGRQRGADHGDRRQLHRSSNPLRPRGGGLPGWTQRLLGPLSGREIFKSGS